MKMMLSHRGLDPEMIKERKAIYMNWNDSKWDLLILKGWQAKLTSVVFEHRIRINVTDNFAEC